MLRCAGGDRLAPPAHLHLLPRWRAGGLRAAAAESAHGFSVSPAGVFDGTVQPAAEADYLHFAISRTPTGTWRSSRLRPASCCSLPACMAALRAAGGQGMAEWRQVRPGGGPLGTGSTHRRSNRRSRSCDPSPEVLGCGHDGLTVLPGAEVRAQVSSDLGVARGSSPSAWTLTRVPSRRRPRSGPRPWTSATVTGSLTPCSTSEGGP